MNSKETISPSTVVQWLERRQETETCSTRSVFSLLRAMLWLIALTIGIKPKLPQLWHHTQFQFVQEEQTIFPALRKSGSCLLCWGQATHQDAREEHPSSSRVGITLPLGWAQDTQREQLLPAVWALKWVSFAAKDLLKQVQPREHCSALDCLWFLCLNCTFVEICTGLVRDFPDAP